MLSSRWSPAAALTAAILVVGAPRAATAQATTFPLEVSAGAGVAIPAGGLAGITDVGVAVGGAVLYRFLPDFAVRADLDADMLDGTNDAYGNLFPSMSLLHITAGIQADLPRPNWQSAPLTTSIDVGLGLTRMDANDQDVPGPLSAFAKTYFATTGGLRIGWRFGEHVEVFGQGRAYLTFGRSSDLAVFSDHSPEVGPFHDVWSFPVTAGLHATF